MLNLNNNRDEDDYIYISALYVNPFCGTYFNVLGAK